MKSPDDNWILSQVARSVTGAGLLGLLITGAADVDLDVDDVLAVVVVVVVLVVVVVVVVVDVVIIGLLMEKTSSVGNTILF